MCITKVTAPNRVYETNSGQVGFVGTIVLMMKTQIGLGILAIPGALDTLGMVPGVICLVGLGCMTTWSDYMIGAFKLRHREVYGIDDAGAVMCGLTGRSILSVAFCLCEHLEHTRVTTTDTI